MDWQEVAAIAAVCGVALVLGGHAVAYGHFRAKVDEARALAAAAMEKTDTISEDFADYREKAAQNFVSQDMIEKFEVKVFGAIDRMGDKLDAALNRLAERLDRVLEGRK